MIVLRGNHMVLTGSTLGANQCIIGCSKCLTRTPEATYCKAGTYKLYPTHYKVLTISKADRTIIAATETKRQHLSVIKQLTGILGNVPPPRVNGQSAPRVGRGATTSTNKTSLRVVKQTKYVHQRRTRSNNPMPTITEEEEPPINATPTQAAKPPATAQGRRANQ